MIYQHRASVTTAAGSVASTTLNVKGGLLQQLVVRANTATTVFRADLVDANSVTVGNWDYHEGELNDIGRSLPMAGTYTLNVTNASPNDTFTILLAVAEN